MIPYQYEKDFAINGEALNDVMKLNEIIWPLIDRIDIQGEKNIEIYTTRLLVSVEEDELISIINAFTVDCEMMVRKNIKENIMAAAMNFGLDLLKEIAASNIYQGKTNEQYHAFLENYNVLIHALQTGSLTIAYIELMAMIPNADFAEEELIEFRRRLAIYLGIA